MSRDNITDPPREAPIGPATGGEELRIEVAPNIVEHLGLNLYTNLPRVLVEFVANAYDADSRYVDIRLDVGAIDRARSALRQEWNRRKQDGGDLSQQTPLEEQTLPQTLSIVIEDGGHGMSRDDLQRKFLRISRKRRDDRSGSVSPGGRPVMGRKGIGKLAGFGVARLVRVTTRAHGQVGAIRITLDYSELAAVQTTAQVNVHEEQLPDSAGLGASGTRIELSQLLFEPTQARLETIAQRVSQYFAIVHDDEFEILLNGQRVPPFARDYAYAYPNADLPVAELVNHLLEIPEAEPVPIRYRIRFTGAGQQLEARDRGVRVYARQRLAATADLLDLKTGIHGFQNTHYLDGEVRADFIDEQRVDYIASNRQGLRWDTPLLSELRAFLTTEMQEACKAYQGTKDETITKRVRADEFTQAEIQKADLPRHRREMAFKIAAKLAGGLPEETTDRYYRETLPIVVRGLGFGDLMGAIAALAQQDSPHLTDAVRVIAQLTAAEWDDYGKIVTARLRGIDALRRIYENVDFARSDNEKELHQLLKENPWLIDPTFWAFLTSNVTERTLSEELSRQLKVDRHVPADYDPTTAPEKGPLEANTRPDLTFLLSNLALQRVVVVELKSPNTPLHADHLQQLEGYMADVTAFLATRNNQGLGVEGYLIGSRHRGSYGNTPKVRHLEYREREAGPSTKWRVFDLGELLTRTENAHREFLETFERAQRSQSEPSDDESENR
jgi:hypothetical protein